MAMRQKVFVFTCATMIALVASWIAAQPKGPARLTADDHIEIEQLYQAYQRGVDGGSRESSWVFTPDGEFVAGRAVTGEKALKEFYTNVNKTHQPKVRRLLSNIIITPTPTGADGSAYLFTIDARDSAKPSMVAYYGVYNDTFVKTAAGWRIKRRVYTQDWPESGPGAR
jgi:hypothetical protein